jgi:hypothetical protein
MNTADNSMISLIERIQRKAPEYLDLLTAEDESEFERAFDALLGKAISQMERNKLNFKDLNEVGLSGILAMGLSIPGLTITPEGHSNGHVDLFIVADHCVPERIKLGEAKIYDGPHCYIEALEQLLGRYTTGRESRGLIIIYFKKDNISILVQRSREVMDRNKPIAQQGNTTDHIHKWSFLSTHTLKSGDNHEVAHVGINLFTD